MNTQTKSSLDQASPSLRSSDLPLDQARTLNGSEESMTRALEHWQAVASDLRSLLVLESLPADRQRVLLAASEALSDALGSAVKCCRRLQPLWREAVLELERNGEEPPF